MSAKPKKKLCWNCEGQVSFQQDNCPYCGVYLNPLDDDNKDTLFSPPYRMKAGEEENQTLPEAPYLVQEEAIVSEPVAAPLPTTSDGLKAILIPLTLILSGAVFLLFGLTLMLFSRNGVFTLRWDGTYWFLYMLAGTPMLIYGWKSIFHVEE
ncbi:MAG: hypothetical protein H0X51_08845 [Parachlamydiaceae bacterium]|nr:hypothetical protein [Parachlamydiaceae bacterium]